MSKSSGTKRSCVEIQDVDLDGLSEEEKRMETKRAYNRKIAARARQRTKDMVDGLSEQVAMHTARNLKLEKAKEELAKKVNTLEEENMLLRQCILDPNSVSREVLERLGLTAANRVSSVSSLDDKNLGNDSSNGQLQRDFGSEEALYRQFVQVSGSMNPSAAAALANLGFPPQALPLHAQQQDLSSQLLTSSLLGQSTPATMYSSPQALAAAGLNANLLPLRLPQTVPSAAVLGASWPHLSDADRQQLLLAQLLRAQQQAQVMPNSTTSGEEGGGGGADAGSGTI